jgi:hypothetical protein
LQRLRTANPTPQRLADGAGGCSNCAVEQPDTPVLVPTTGRQQWLQQLRHASASKPTRRREIDHCSGLQRHRLLVGGPLHELRKLSDVNSDAPCLVAREQSRSSASAWFVLVIHVAERLAVGIAHDKARTIVFNVPRRCEAAIRHGRDLGAPDLDNQGGNVAADQGCCRVKSSGSLAVPAAIFRASSLVMR